MTITQGDLLLLIKIWKFKLSQINIYESIFHSFLKRRQLLINLVLGVFGRDENYVPEK